MKFSKKFLLICLAFASLKDAKALLPEDNEVTLALLRIPVVCAANVVGLAEHKNLAQKSIVFSADIIRVAGAILAIKNNPNSNDWYDCIWLIYDDLSGFIHFLDLFKSNNGEEKIKIDEAVEDTEEIKKLNAKLKALYGFYLPFIEGITAYFAVVKKGNSKKDVDFRRLCKSVNSMFRVLDKLIISEKKSFEQYAWAVILGLNVVYFVYYLLEESRRWEEEWRNEEWRKQDEFFRNFFRDNFGGAGSQSNFHSRDKVSSGEERRRACELLGISLENARDREIVNRAFRRAAKTDQSRIKDFGAARDILIPRQADLLYGEGNATGL